MSKISPLDSIRLLATLPHPCGYLDGRESTTVFVDPSFDIEARTYGHLTTLGFRRSGEYLYRPHCADCSACVPSRIPVGRFQPSRQQRKTLKRNRDLVPTVLDDIVTDEHYGLYARYIEGRHKDGEMYPPSREQFDNFLATSGWGTAAFVEFRKDGRLVCVAVTDITPAGLSAVYTFYDPLEVRRSLGTFSILYQVEWARELGLPAVYLGYWIEECRKMAYKQQFQPLELFRDMEWRQHIP
ncbi:arginyltransferase [Biformimicrobium ophioploci]|uniref:Aspartate/glutamate leucyltransferase n=1 Tax=Biformimicrobium ophioploci TaxID=3036711 RepID=A0ABQ6M1I0_9GAMM|nr:arginyltransferase [Microbulbifer sp. NKW57]GMG88214.1 arginyltransferase [Microbulbifer sp. NKW57]